MRTARLIEQARDEIRDAAEYYERCVSGLGSDFTNRVDPSEIVIVAVMHQSRRPGYWVSRVG